ncbi:MAG: DUF2231 domain-containing protein [Solirubrobacterales bacterium]|nr:DUF2231 domain-containing protein [Solirubrobacterales bacterium]
MIGLLRGFPGKPSHPPLTDVAIGGYTISVIMLVLGALDVRESQMAVGALLALSGGLIFGALAAVTGLLDWLKLPKGSELRRVATVHLLVMVSATVLFVLTWLAQRPGYNHGDVKTVAWILGVIAEVFLIVGGYLGGTIVFVYGHRVLKLPDTRLADALIPGRAEHVNMATSGPTEVRTPQAAAEHDDPRGDPQYPET